METDLLQNLRDLGYEGSLTDADELSKALAEGPKSVEFTKLVAWLAEQLCMYEKFEEVVNPITIPDEASHFLLELSSFLKELGCTNQNLVSGTVNQRLATRYDRLVLLDYLVTELMTGKILATQKSNTSQEIELTIHESSTAKCLKDMLLALKFQKPPDNISPAVLFGKVEAKLKEILAHVPPELLGSPLFIGELSTDQWQQLDDLQLDLMNEYQTRREMLLKRLDVTVQSFLWSEQVRQKEDELKSSYQSKRSRLLPTPNVRISDVLAGRTDLAVIEKTSNATVRKNTRSQINQVIIGAVPDRGGRTCDHIPPPPEMPSWQKNRVAGPSTFRGGRGGGGTAGGTGGGRGGYRDHKDASRNFGQNQDNYQQQRQYQTQQQTPYNPTYSDRGGGEYQRGGKSRVQGGWNQGGDGFSSGYQRGSFNRGRSRGGRY